MSGNPPINSLSYGQKSGQHNQKDFGSTAFKSLLWALLSNRNTRKLD